MGKLNDSLLSGSSGRTGKLVVANVGGIEILRVRPRKSTRPPSPKQLLIQDRMKRCYDFILPYKAYASSYFGYRVGMRSCYNQAISNLLNAFKIDNGNYTIIPMYDEIMFSNGKLLTIIPTALSSPAAGQLMIDWYNNAAGDSERENDRLQILMAADSENKPIFLPTTVLREEATTTISVTPNLVGKTVHVWIAFLSTDNISASASVYVGSVLVN